jgi:N-acetylglucosaminyl-diphospho-decaprenol L-rhamnosyltransferase
MVNQVMGAAFLVRREVWEQLYGLDQKFWIWFEEVDFCRRAWNAGWQTWYTPAGEVVHYGGASFHQLVGWKKSTPWIKSSLRYARKHLNWLVWLGLIGLTPVAWGLAGLAMVTHVRVKKENKARL